MAHRYPGSQAALEQLAPQRETYDPRTYSRDSLSPSSPDLDGGAAAAAAAAATTTRLYDSPTPVPGSPSFSNSAFTYTNDESRFGADGPLHPKEGSGASFLNGNSSTGNLSYGGGGNSAGLESGAFAKRQGAGMFAGRKKWYWVAGGLLGLAVAAGAVVGGLKASSSTKSHSGSGAGISSSDRTGSNNDAGFAGEAIPSDANGNGTVVTMENGQTFTYVNNFGGYFVSTPFDDSARPQEWTPALNETWDYTNDKIYGVNLGGWLVLEPFIVPGPFEQYEQDAQPAVDEYTLMGKWGANATARMQEHYETFITEEDFALIAGAGLNWIRIPIGHWAIETVDGEPFVEGLSWQYFLKALTWARKYGLRVNLDLHTAPGSQNGWNHSGRLGTIGWLRGVMGLSNAQRSLNHIRTLTEFISQPQYKNVVQMFSIMNEPQSTSIGAEALRNFNMQAYDMIRDITGTGEGKGPWVMIHDGFEGLNTWRGFMSGADRLAIDQHNYLVFVEPNLDSPQYAAMRPCTYWGQGYNASMRNFGLTVSGEWCLAINDCGQYLNNVGNGARYNGTYIQPGRSTPQFPGVGSCEPWNDYRTWSDSIKSGLIDVAYAHMDATQNWFFWTWKIGTSTRTGIPPNPFWHMKLGLQEGYFPKDPRRHAGQCARIVSQQGAGTYNTAGAFTAFPSPWMTGGAGAGTVAPAQVSSYGQWPPASFADAVGGQVTNLPSYTPTGTPITLRATPTAAPTGAAAASYSGAGNGWANPSDTAGYYVTKPGCNYLNPYSGIGAPVPTAAC